MTGWSELNRLFKTDPRDVGCDEAIRMLHIYVDLVLGIPGDDGTGEAATRYPGVAAHLAARGPCGEDYRGLLAAASGQEWTWPTRR